MILVAPRIVNNVSCVKRINDECYFLWQAQQVWTMTLVPPRIEKMISEREFFCLHALLCAAACRSIVQCECSSPACFQGFCKHSSNRASVKKLILEREPFPIRFFFACMRYCVQLRAAVVHRQRSSPPRFQGCC